MLATFTQDRLLASLTVLALTLFVVALALVIATTPVVANVALLAFFAGVLPALILFALVSAAVLGYRSYARLQVRFTTAWMRRHFFLHVAQVMACAVLGCFAVALSVALSVLIWHCPVVVGCVVLAVAACVAGYWGLWIAVSYRRVVQSQVSRLVARCDAMVPVAIDTLPWVAGLSVFAVAVYCMVVAPLTTVSVVVLLLVAVSALIEAGREPVASRVALVGVPGALPTAGLIPTVTELLNRMPRSEVVALARHARQQMASETPVADQPAKVDILALVAAMSLEEVREVEAAVAARLATANANRQSISAEAEGEMVGFVTSDVSREDAEQINAYEQQSAASATATLVRKPRARKTPRTYTLVNQLEPGVSIVDITTRGRTDTYEVTRFEADWGTGLHWRKTHTNGQRVQHDGYDSNIGDATAPASCDCMGAMQYGCRKPCRHIACGRLLVARGEI